jgi:hypothetical protein
MREVAIPPLFRPTNKIISTIHLHSGSFYIKEIVVSPLQSDYTLLTETTIDDMVTLLTSLT